MQEILALTGQAESNTHKVPMLPCNPSFTMVQDLNNKNDAMFRKLDKKKHHHYKDCIGKLMYLMVYTRPDIAFTVNFLARACAAPEYRHMQSINNLARYLKYTNHILCECFFTYMKKWQTNNCHHLIHRSRVCCSI